MGGGAGVSIHDEQEIERLRNVLEQLRIEIAELKSDIVRLKRRVNELSNV
jgi:hypothetical protein